MELKIKSLLSGENHTLSKFLHVHGWSTQNLGLSRREEITVSRYPHCAHGRSPQNRLLSSRGLRSSWSFHSFQTVILQILLNNPSSVRSCIIIHQNEVVTNSSSIWADIWIKDLIPISKTSYGSSMEHMQISRRPESLSIVNLDSSVNSTEAHCCCVQETCSLAQHKRFLRCRPLRGTHATGLLAYRPAL
ncbi:uncharacterized protein TNCV_1844961 [Trichonephila clavipes]|nr:uncharacterized protein TNCV_1844961 [Trichonephila clavipes]